MLGCPDEKEMFALMISLLGVIPRKKAVRTKYNRGAQLMEQKAIDNKQARERERDGFTTRGYAFKDGER